MSYITIESGSHTFNFHEVLYNNMVRLIKACKRDWDFKILISGDGMTRTGKTTLACQLALVLDPTVDIDRVIFRGYQLIEKSLKTGKHRAIIYDEAKEGLDSKKAMQQYSQNITDYFSECGWMNQFLIVVLPEFFDLNKTVALNQSICLINCYCKDNFNRGHFEFFNRKHKRYLYIKGKRYNNYHCQTPTFKGDFVKFFPFDETDYEKRKQENQRALKGDDAREKGVPGSFMSVREKKYRNGIARLAKHIRDNYKTDYKTIGDISGFGNATIHRMVNDPLGYDK